MTGYLERPVFVCGTGTSGTKLLLELVAAQPAFFAFGELETRFMVSNGGVLDLFRAHCEDFGFERTMWADKAFRVLMLESLATGGRYGEEGLDIYLPNGHYHKSVETYLDQLSGSYLPRQLSEAEFISITRSFITQLIDPMKVDQDASRWVEKTPHTILHARFVHRIFPDARFLHVTRDPRAVARSLMRQTWAPNSFAGCLEWLSQVYARMEIELQYLTRHPNVYRQVRLEDLVLARADLQSALAGFLELDHFDLQGMRFDSEKLFGWAEGISAAEDEQARDVLAPAFQAFGYEQDLTWWLDKVGGTDSA